MRGIAGMDLAESSLVRRQTGRWLHHVGTIASVVSQLKAHRAATHDQERSEPKREGGRRMDHQMGLDEQCIIGSMLDGE